MARVLDSVTLPIKKNGTKTNQNYVNNPKSTAGQFSTSTAYAVGQYVYYDKKLYRFTTAHAAGAWNASHVTEVTVTSELTSLKAETNDLKQDLNQEKKYQLLLDDGVPNTVQEYTFSGGAVSQVTHKRSGTTIRTDVFTYGTSSITEVRTLNTGESMTIATSLETLETSVTYTAA